MQRIDKNKARPLYLQLMDIIISSIEAGEYKAEEKLPSERDLCKELSLSRSTVRQAIRELEIEGYVYKQHGRGTFVSPEKYRQDLLKFYSFTAEMKRIGKKPSSKVLNFEIVEPFNNIKQIMNLKDGDRTYRFTRLRLADEMPMMLEVSYIPEKRVKDLSKEDLENNPMYYLFKNKYNIELTGATETFQSVLTNKNEADILKYREGLASKEMLAKFMRSVGELGEKVNKEIKMIKRNTLEGVGSGSEDVEEPMSDLEDRAMKATTMNRKNE